MNTSYNLLRQVHPSFLKDGKLLSQAFFPFPKDKGKLSAYDERLISPVKSYMHYTQELGLNSEGVWGVSNVEVHETGLTHEADPLPIHLHMHLLILAQLLIKNIAN